MAFSGKEALFREMERKSLDTLMVYNPTDADYKVIWDKRSFVIPASTKDLGHGKGKMILPRYIAEKYAKEMKDILITREADEMVKKQVEKHYDAGREQLDSYSINVKFADKAPKTNDMQRVEKIYNTLILGIVQEFSGDYVDDLNNQADTRPIEEVIAENMNRPYNPDENLEEMKSYALEDIAE